MRVDKDKQQFIILGVIVSVLIVATVATVFKPRPRRAVKARPPVASEAGTPAQEPKPTPQKEQIVSSFKMWGRDPFAVGAGVAASADGAGSLTGIFCDPKMSYCIIDGNVVKVGDEVSGYKILEINKDAVTVKIGDEIRVLKVGR